MNIALMTRSNSPRYHIAYKIGRNAHPAYAYNNNSPCIKELYLLDENHSIALCNKKIGSFLNLYPTNGYLTLEGLYGKYLCTRCKAALLRLMPNIDFPPAHKDAKPR